EEDIATGCPDYRMAPRTCGVNSEFALYGGIAWGGGNSATGQASYSSIVIGGWHGPCFKVVHITRLIRHEAAIDKQPAIFDRIMRAFKIQRGLGDYGFGTINNRRFVNDYKWDPKVFMEAQAANTQA